MPQRVTQTECLVAIVDGPHRLVSWAYIVHDAKREELHALLLGARVERTRRP